MVRLTNKDVARRVMPVLNRNPSASMEQIADATGLGRATLFRRFGSRAGLVRTLILQSLHDSCDRMTPILEAEGTADEKIRAVVAAMVELSDEFGFLVYEPWQLADPEAEKLNAQCEALWKTLVEQWHAEGFLADGVPLAFAARALDNLIWTAWLCIRDGDMALNDAPDLVLAAFRRTSAAL